MSRTDKDRPYWVQAQDNTLRTRERHDHDSFGRTYSRLKVRGEKTLIEYGEHVWIQRYSRQTPGMTPEEHKEAHRWDYWRSPYFEVARGHLRWYFERRTRYEYVGRVETQVSYADYCTIDEFDLPYFRHEPKPCDRMLDYGYSYWNDRRGAEDRALYYHRPARRAARQAMHNYVGEYNTFGEVDDSAWQDYQTRHVPWGGGYWD